jgi:hypothetical protein
MALSYKDFMATVSKKGDKGKKEEPKEEVVGSMLEGKEEEEKDEGASEKISYSKVGKGESDNCSTCKYFVSKEEGCKVTDVSYDSPENSWCVLWEGGSGAEKDVKGMAGTGKGKPFGGKSGGIGQGVSDS